VTDVRTPVASLLCLTFGFAIGLASRTPSPKLRGPPSRTTSVASPHSAATASALDTSPVAQAPAEVHEPLKTARIVGRVYTRRGAGVAGVTVTAHRESEAEDAPDAPEGTATTDARGDFSIEGLRPGQFHVEALEREGLSTMARRARAEHDDAAPSRVSVGVREGEPLEGRVDFLATILRRVRARVVGPSGESPSDAEVELTPRDDHIGRFGHDWTIAQPDLWLPEGIYVAGGEATFPTSVEGESLRIALAPEPFTVGTDADPPLVTITAPAPCLLTGAVATDDPDAEDWEKVYVAARPIVVPDPGDPRGGLMASEEVCARLLGRSNDVPTAIDGSVDAEGRFSFRALFPGTYELTAGRLVEPAEPPGESVNVVVPRFGEATPFVRLALPRAEPKARVSIRLVNDRGESTDRAFNIVLERRAGGDVTLVDSLWHTNLPSYQRDEDVLLVRASAWRDPGGRPATLVVRLERLAAALESAVPEGEDVRVELRLPSPATLTARMDRSAYPPDETRIVAFLRRGERAGEAPAFGEGITISREEVPASGEVRLEGAFPGIHEVVIACRALSTPSGCALAEPRGEDGMDLRDDPDESNALVVLARRVVTLPAGDSAVALSLRPGAGATIVPDRAGDLLVYPARPDAEGELFSARVAAGVPCALPTLAPVAYVAILLEAPDALAPRDERPSRGCMLFTATSGGKDLAFAPTPLEGPAAYVYAGVRSSEAAGVRRGDVVIEVDGEPVRDPWSPLATALASPPRTPDEARVTVIRSGVRLDVVEDLSWKRRWGDHERYGPIPR